MALRIEVYRKLCLHSQARGKRHTFVLSSECNCGCSFALSECTECVSSSLIFPQARVAPVPVYLCQWDQHCADGPLSHLDGPSRWANNIQRSTWSPACYKRTGCSVYSHNHDGRGQTQRHFNQMPNVENWQSYRLLHAIFCVCAMNEHMAILNQIMHCCHSRCHCQIWVNSLVSYVDITW